MSAKNSLTLFRAVKSDYAYLISLMGFSWLSLYGYPGEWEFHDVVATFSFLLILRCKWFHFLMVLLIGLVPIGRYPLMVVKNPLTDNLFTFFYVNPLQAFHVLTQIPLTAWVPTGILMTLMGVLTYLQTVKNRGFNLLRLELGVISLTIIGGSALFNGIEKGWTLQVFDYPVVAYWIAFITERVYG